MAHFRVVFVILFLLTGFSHIQAQKNPVLYAGFDYYRSSAFENSYYGALNAGIQMYHWKFLAPEVGVDHFYGRFEGSSIRSGSTVEGISEAKLNENFSATVLTLSPKLKIGKDDAFITFSPKYHVGNVYARARYFLYDERFDRYEVVETQEASAPTFFWSFSLGVEGLAIQTEKYWFTLFLNYTEVDSREAFAKLDFSHRDAKTPGHNSATIGFGVRFYFNPFPSEND